MADVGAGRDRATKRRQRVVARKEKFSNNWKKAKAKVARVHADIANARRDFLNKVSTTIAKNHGVVFLEDLKVKSMSASAAGTIEHPGRNVRAKAGLNRAILDQGWGEFLRMLRYKMAWRGGRLMVVPAQYTSQECPACHNIAAKNRKSQALFECVECGFTANADLVGAINVRERGLAPLLKGLDTARIACGASPAREALAQEPTEATQAVFA